VRRAGGRARGRARGAGSRPDRADPALARVHQGGVLQRAGRVRSRQRADRAASKALPNGSDAGTRPSGSRADRFEAETGSLRIPACGDGRPTRSLAPPYRAANAGARRGRRSLRENGSYAGRRPRRRRRGGRFGDGRPGAAVGAPRSPAARARRRRFRARFWPGRGAFGDSILTLNPRPTRLEALRRC